MEQLSACTTATEPTCSNYWSQDTPEPALHHRRGYRNEKPMRHQPERSPRSPQETACVQQGRPSTAKRYVKVKEIEVAQSCPTLCDPMDCSLLGSSVYGIFQARILEWVAMPFSRGSSWPRGQTCVSYSSCTAGRFFTTELLGKPLIVLNIIIWKYYYLYMVKPSDQGVTALEKYFVVHSSWGVGVCQTTGEQMGG